MNEIDELQINFLLHLSLIVIAYSPGVFCVELIGFIAQSRLSEFYTTIGEERNREKQGKREKY